MMNKLWHPYLGHLKRFSVCALLLCSSNLWAQSLTDSNFEEYSEVVSKDEKRLWGAWSFGLFGQTFSDLTDSETYASARLNLKGELKLLSALKVQAGLSLVGASGFSQARFGKDSLGNGININEAMLVAGENFWFRLDAGIINQRFLNSPLLVSNLPFPGVRQTLRYQGRLFEVGLRAQQAIPTSRTLNSQKRSEKEETPQFFTESFYLSFKPHDDFNALLQVSHYRYSNLPSSVAESSRLLGNTVPFSTAAQSKFLYDFEGMLYTFSATQYIIDDTSADLNLQLLQNDKAPDAYNRGFLIEAGINFPVFQQMMRLSLANFFNESDSAPGQYNSSRIGHNNMKGNSAAVAIIINQNFKIEAQYTDSEVINTNLVNSRRQNFSLALETLYVNF